jgi:hypothetical protein
LLRVSKKTTVKISPRYQVWWYILIIPVPKRQRQKDQFKASLGYVPRPSLKKKKKESQPGPQSFQTATEIRICFQVHLVVVGRVQFLGNALSCMSHGPLHGEAHKMAIS